MKRCVIIILLFVSFAATAQDYDSGNETVNPAKLNPAIWKHGYLIFLKGDTVSGKLRIEHTLFYDHYQGVQFCDTGGHIVLYKPRELRGYYYTDMGMKKENVFVSLENTIYTANPEVAKKKYFFRLEQDGRCKIYTYYGYNSDGIVAVALLGALGAVAATLDMEEGYCIQSGGSDVWVIDKPHFKRDMSEFFNLCPFIVSKIKAKEYTYKNWRSLVEDYNSNGCH
jgi:hypothetical protein